MTATNAHGRPPESAVVIGDSGTVLTVSPGTP